MGAINVKQSNPDIYAKIKTNIKILKEYKVVAGFPKGKLNAPHYENSKDKPSIIDVAIRNNFGIGVPRRDFMTPASKKWNEEIQKKLDVIGEDLADGKLDSKNFLKTMGQLGADIISKEIEILDTPPNSPETIKAKGSSNPLVDSGDMSNAPKYELRRIHK